MDTDNLAMVMGPTVIGYSCNDPGAIISETHLQKQVMRTLMGLTADYWSTFLAVDQENILGFKLTPTTITQRGMLHSGNTPDQPIFNPPLAAGTYHGIGNTPLTGGPVARRTRSKQMHKQFSKKNIPKSIFQSPMLL